MNEHMITFYKILNNLSKYNKYYEKYKSDNSDKLNINDCVLYAFILLLDTGYFFHERLDNVDWNIDRDEISDDFTIDGKMLHRTDPIDIYNIHNIDKTISESYKFDYNDFYNDEFNKIHYLDNMKNLYGYKDDLFYLTFNYDINEIISLLRNAIAHCHFNNKIDIDILSINVNKKNISLSYSDIFYLLKLFIEYVVDYSDFSSIGNLPSYVEKDKNYEYSKRKYRKYFKGTVLSDRLETIIKRINNITLSSPELYETAGFLLKYNNLSVEEFEKVINSSSDTDLDYIKNCELEIEIRQLCETYKKDERSKSKCEKKLEEYKIIFDEIYKNINIDYWIPENMSKISENIEDIDEIFKYLIKTKPQCFNEYQDKSLRANEIILITLILGMLPWNDVDIVDLDLSKIKIDSNFINIKNCKYNDELLNLSNKYYEIEENIKRLSNNIDIPKDKLKHLIDNQNKKKNEIINSIYNKKEIKDNFISNSNIIRHLRNSFAHGFYTFDEDNIYIEDYDKQNNLTFSAYIYIYDLLDILLSDKVLNKINGYVNQNSSIRK